MSSIKNPLGFNSRIESNTHAILSRPSTKIRSKDSSSNSEHTVLHGRETCFTNVLLGVLFCILVAQFKSCSIEINLLTCGANHLVEPPQPNSKISALGFFFKNVSKKITAPFVNHGYPVLYIILSPYIL